MLFGGVAFGLRWNSFLRLHRLNCHAQESKLLPEVTLTDCSNV
jgi:hypothetical protein